MTDEWVNLVVIMYCWEVHNATRNSYFTSLQVRFAYSHITTILNQIKYMPKITKRVCALCVCVCYQKQVPHMLFF